MSLKSLGRQLGLVTMLAVSQVTGAQTPEMTPPGKADDSLDASLRWGIHCISNILNPEDGNRPYFECFVLDHPRMGFSHKLSVGNVTGRCLYALLKASEALGEESSPETVTKYRKVLLESFEKVRGIPADPREQGGPLVECWTFNSGQGLRGLLGLAAFQNDAQAAQLLNESFANLKHHYSDVGFSWRAFSDHFALVGGGTGGSLVWPGPDPLSPSLNPFLTWSVARYARLSHSVEASELARALGYARFDFRFPADGILRLYGDDHGFEIAAETNALAEVGTLLGDEKILQRVKSRVDNGLSRIMTKSGWFPERLGRDSDVGEANNTAEVIEACLLLGDWGWPEYYGVAERYTRAHLLPSQLLDMSWIPASPADPPRDGESRVKERVKGAFGFPAPYGHLATKNPYLNGAFMFDIVAGAVASLAEVRQHCYSQRAQAHYVHLLFDFENDKISVKSPYPDSGTIKITLRQPGNLYIRLADWVEREKVRASGSGRDLAGEPREHYFVITSPPVGEEISIEYPLALSESTEDLNGRTLRTLWRGDSVIGMSGMGTKLPFFPEIDAALEQVHLEELGAGCILLASETSEEGDPVRGKPLEQVEVTRTPTGGMCFDGVDSRLIPFFPDRDYTFEAWIAPATESSGEDTPQRVFSAWRDTYDDPLRVSIYSGQVSAGLETEGKAYETAGVPIREPGWFHVAAVKEGEHLRLYVNGEPMAQVPVPARIQTGARNAGVGFNPLYGGGEFYRGGIGNFTFRGCALNGEEVRSVMGDRPAN